MKSFYIFLFLVTHLNIAYATTEKLQEIRLCYEDVSVHPWITGDMKGLVIQQLQIIEKTPKVK